MIRRVGIVGAGSMGGAIAGVVASAGLEVVLLDVRGDDEPNAPARRGLERAVANRAFLDPDAVERVTVGNTDEHLSLLADCDWILEAIVEDREVKRAFFRSLVDVVRSDALITTNTSTFALASLLPDEAASWRERFFATHFFNPPRALLLTEVACLPEADRPRFDWFVRFLERQLGRRALVVRDSPGFVANRFGIYSLVLAIRLTGELGLTVEEVDALTGPLLGRPRSATFRTIDLTGLDILVLGTGSLQESTGDDYSLPPWVRRLFDEGHLGDKTGGGFFRRDGDNQLSLDIETGTYRPYREPEIPGLAEVLSQPFPERLKAAIRLPDPYGSYVRALLGGTYRYVLDKTPDVAVDLPAVDRALEWGFGWAAGPYRQMSSLGPDLVAELVASADQGEPDLLARARRHGGFYPDGGALDIASDAVVPLDAVPTAGRDRQARAWAELERRGIHDLGDGVVAVRVPAIDQLPELIASATRETWPQALALVPRMEGLGYPYGRMLELAESGDWHGVEDVIAGVRRGFLALAESGLPIVVVLDGQVRGAATTVALWADRTVAYVTSVLGFPELGAGLLPLGAVTGLLARGDMIPGNSEGDATAGNGRPAQDVDGLQWFSTATATSIPSAARAQRLGVLASGDVVSLNRDGLLDVARAVGSTLASSVRARPVNLPALDERGVASLRARVAQIAEHAGLPSAIGEVWAQAVTNVAGGIPIADALAYEGEAWAKALRDGEVRARLQTVVREATARRR